VSVLYNPQSCIEGRRRLPLPLLAIVAHGDTAVRAVVEQPHDIIIDVPAIEEVWSPLLTVIPLQLLAYHTAVRAGRDVDQPRNLAKSVTVE